MKVGSLFAGIGGFDLAAESVGWETAWYSEIDAYASAVMRKHFPRAVNHGDITTIDGNAIEHVDVLCGGFPCQDISLAGKGAGLEGSRSGLWSHYARLIGEIKPKWVVIENVSALRSRGLDVVLGEISALGYDAEWHCIPAAYVGAPHRRDRVWITARRNTDDEGQPTRAVDDETPWLSGVGTVADAGYAERREDDSEGRRYHGENGATTGRQQSAALVTGSCETLADANSESRYERRSSDASESEGGRDADRSGERANVVADAERAGWGRALNPECAASRIAVCGGEALSGGRGQFAWQSGWDVEPNVGRVAHGVPSRVDRLRCLGNAIVPQVAQLIFQAINEVEASQYANAHAATLSE